MALTANDADDWTYRGKGAMNVVFAYAGNSPEFVSFSSEDFNSCLISLK